MKSDSPSRDTDTLTRPDEVVTEEGDHDRFSHYIFATDPGAVITEALVNGTPLKALCGKVWVPSRNSADFPVCQMCMEIKKQILSQSRDT